MLSKADVWQLRERESKEGTPLSLLPKLPPFSIFWFVLTRKQKSIVVNWRVEDAQCTVHMQDGTCELAQDMIHMSTPSISSFSSM